MDSGPEGSLCSVNIFPGWSAWLLAADGFRDNKEE